MSETAFMDIRASHILSAFVSIVLAIAIGYYVNVFLKKKYSIVDAATSSIKDIESHLRDLTSQIPEIVKSKTKVSQTTLNITTSISVHISKLCLVLDHMKKSNLVEPLKTDFFALKRALTNASISEPINETFVRSKISAFHSRINSTWFHIIR